MDDSGAPWVGARLICRGLSRFLKVVDGRDTGGIQSKGRKTMRSVGKMTERIKFTKKALRELALPPAGKRGRVFDTMARAYVRHNPRCRKTFFLRRKVKGENILLRAWRLDEVSIEQARDKAKLLKGMISDGGNPGQEGSREG